MKNLILLTTIILVLGSHLLNASVRFAFESTNGNTTISGVLMTSTTEAELEGNGVIRCVVTGAESLFINGSRVIDDLDTTTVRSGATGQTTGNTDSFFYNLDLNETEPSNGNALIFDSNGEPGAMSTWQIGHGHIEDFRHYSFNYGRINTETGEQSFSFVASRTIYTPLLPVSVTQSQTQTVAGQDFSFAFSDLATPSGLSGGWVTVNLSNVDLSFTQSFENFTYSIDGVVAGGPVAGEDLDSISSTTGGGSIDGSITFDLTAAQLVAILTDGTVVVTLDFTSGVGFNGPDPVEVAVTISYDVSQAPPPVTLFDVTFSEGSHGQRVGGGALQQSVPEGSSAVAPLIEPDFGWDFIGWDLPFQNIASDLTVTAQYAVATHEVSFVPGPNAVRAGGGGLMQNITHGAAAIAPILSVASGFVFTGWDKSFDPVTEDLTVTALFGIDFNNSDADDDAVLTGDRKPPSDESTETVEIGSLTVNADTAFELGPMETLVLNSGPLTISEGGSFTANGTIIGSVINAGLLRIPVLGLPDITNTGVIVVIVEVATTVTRPIRMEGGIVRFSGEETTIDVPLQQNDGILATDANLEVTGDFDQSATGALRLFISGDVPGETYSQLKTGGNVTLDGSLQIVFRPDDLSFLPRPDDFFDFVLTDPGSTITLAPGFEVINLVEASQTGAFDEDGIVHFPYDSGLASGVDPDDLRQIDQQLFALSLIEGGTILRATYIGPDLNDFYENAPSDIIASANTVSESDGPGTVIATLSAVDASGGPHSFSLVAGDGSEDNALFGIAGNQLRTAAHLDFEQNDSHKIRIRATDPDGRYTEKIFIVQILNTTDDDDDGDGLTEAEENALGTQMLSADTDGDGISDGDEVKAWGTDPLNGGDRVRYTGENIIVDGSQITIEWSTVVGKNYKIEGNQTLDKAGWAELPGTFIGTGGSVSATIDTTGGDYRFFRIKAQP